MARRGKNYVHWFPQRGRKVFRLFPVIISLLLEIRQDAQVSQWDQAAGRVSFGQKWKTGTGRQYFTDIIGLSSTTVT